MIEIVLGEMNGFLELDKAVAQIRQEVASQGSSAENRINSIASRTHIFGGSGWGLILSACAADDAVRRDRKAIASIQKSQTDTIRHARAMIEEAGLRQSISEYRAKLAISVLLRACGKPIAAEPQMPTAVEDYLLSSAGNPRIPG